MEYSQGGMVELREPKLVFLEGENRCPYRWSTGGTVGGFLTALRDHRKILGGVCGGCGAVGTPPASYCETCSSNVEELTEVGPRGVVMSWSRVAEPFEGAPMETPFRYVLVRLAGADTSLVHLAPDDDRIEVGAVVAPEFREERQGSITDIKWFVPMAGWEPGEDDD
jgi:uncharacterized OB-fold protein